MTEQTESEDPLDRLFVEDDDERPAEVAVDELTTMDADAFVEHLEALANAADALDTLTRDLERLRRTGLTDEDARDLLYGRNASLTKSDIEAVFDATDDLTDGQADRPLVRLLSDLSNLTLAETEEILDELERLNQQYGGADDDE